MTETIQIFIDGKLVDVSTDTNIQLEIKSNVLTDIDNIECNRTYTIELPKTLNNMAIMGIPDRLGIKNDWAHKYHTCEYRRNGVPIIMDGKATMTECTDAIALVIYWGTFGALQKLREEDLSLCNLESMERLIFNSVNNADDFEIFKAKGVGYADYVEEQMDTLNEEWSGTYAVTSKMNAYKGELTDGARRYTGKSIGGTATQSSEGNTLWQSGMFYFISGMRAELKGIAGTGNYRSYAIIQSDGKVLQLSEDTAVATHGADLYRSDSNVVGGEGICLVDNLADETVIKGISVKIAAETTELTYSYGRLYVSGGNVSTMVERSGNIPANWSGIWNINCNFKKAQGEYFYFKIDKKCVMMYDVAGGSTSGVYDQNAETPKLEWTDTVQNMIQITYEGGTPTAQDYTLECPYGASLLIVNNLKSVGTSPAVTLYSNTQIDTIGSEKRYKAIQPSVTASWINELIRQQTGITLSFPDDIAEELKMLAVPLIRQQTDEYTLTDNIFSATGYNKSSYGLIQLNITKLPDAMRFIDNYFTLGVTRSLKMELTVTADVQFSIADFNFIDAGNGKMITWTYWDFVAVEIGDESFIIGGNGYETSVMSTSLEINKSDTSGGMYSARLFGRGVVSWGQGQQMHIRFKHGNYVGADKDRKSLYLYNIIIEGKIIDDGGMPYGGYFPIAKNLPDISVIDWVKFLTLVTGTFAKQNYNKDEIEFVKYEDIFTKSPIDWSKKLVPATKRNNPSELTFAVDGWARNNRYKWKEDDKTIDNLDGNIQIDNETLEYERTVIELPFAASDGSRVPIRTPRHTKYVSNQGFVQLKVEGYEYEECEPRIMNVVDVNGKAALSFNIRLNDIFKKRYKGIVAMMQDPHVIKDKLMLSNLEVASFDETQPIYIRQYGQSFLVTEMSASSDGYVEATMIQINDYEQNIGEQEQ